MAAEMEGWKDEERQRPDAFAFICVIHFSF